MLPQNVIIAGSGGLGRELLFWLKQGEGFGKTYHVKGFLDDNEALAGAQLSAPWLGTIRDYRPVEGDKIALGIGNPAPRKAVVEQLKSAGASFFTFIHPSVIVGERVSIGEGTIICPRCVITCDITIGEFCLLNLGITVGHDVTIGAYTSVFSQVDLCGGVTVGNGATLGSGCRLIPGIKVGDNAKVGAGAVVVGHVRPGITVLGNPAKVLR